MDQNRLDSLEMAKKRNKKVEITYSYDSDMILTGEELVGVHFGNEHSVDPLADLSLNHEITGMCSRIVTQSSIVITCIIDGYPFFPKIS